MTVRAIFENGVFRPRGAVALPEHTEVDLEIERVKGRDSVNLSPEGMEAIYAILSERYDGGDPEVSAKHNEHQP
jgi:predicted DNA-binding antitoxin AbrB/MazE fold protein